MKTERLTLRTTRAFKEFLTQEANRTGLSVSELVQLRCEVATAPEEAILRELTAELRESVREARTSLRRTIADATFKLAKLRKKEAEHPGISSVHS